VFPLSLVEALMNSGRYPVIHCDECGEHMRLIAICEKLEEGTETRFYECSNPLCRDSCRTCVPNLRASGWIGLQQDFVKQDKKPN
jgi:hypothetical protein